MMVADCHLKVFLRSCPLIIPGKRLKLSLKNCPEALITVLMHAVAADRILQGKVDGQSKNQRTSKFESDPMWPSIVYHKSQHDNVWPTQLYLSWKTSQHQTTVEPSSKTQVQEPWSGRGWHNADTGINRAARFSKDKEVFQQVASSQALPRAARLTRLGWRSWPRKQWLYLGHISSVWKTGRGLNKSIYMKIMWNWNAEEHGCKCYIRLVALTSEKETKDPYNL